MRMYRTVATILITVLLYYRLQKSVAKTYKTDVTLIVTISVTFP